MAGLLGEVMGWVWLPLMLSNWQWDKWGARVKRCVPGSLHHAHALGMRRRWRWPGFLFWPVVLPSWAVYLGHLLSEGSGWTWLWALLILINMFALRADWRKFRRELEEDEDDWFNKGKRKLRRLARAARRSLVIRVPQPAHARF